MKFTSTDKAPAALGPYSQAVSVNGLLFTHPVRLHWTPQQVKSLVPMFRHRLNRFAKTWLQFWKQTV